jgi:hypothetical protein
MKTAHIDEKRTLLIRRREELLQEFNECVRARKRTARVCLEIRRANDFLASLDAIVAENTPAPDAHRRYAASSLFLHDCFAKLTADPNEQFFFITGSEVEHVCILDQWAEFAHHRRSRLGVVADMPSMHNLLIKLERFGHKFLAHFHSHPGSGPDATHPSGIDEDFQRRLEKAGHVALMAIFSGDGYIRFVRMDRRFEIQIYGTGVEIYAPSVYRLKNID